MSGSNIRLALLFTGQDLPAEEERQRFFDEFGRQHCFIAGSRSDKVHFFTLDGLAKLPFELLPVDYLYAPDDWQRRLTNNQLKNVLLALKHAPNDLVIVSGALSEFPLVEVSSLRNQTVFSKELGLQFPEHLSGKKLNGKIVRLLPYDHPVSEINVEEFFRNCLVEWVPEPCWPPRSKIGSLALPRKLGDKESFIPRFKKQKPLIFVWPMLWVVGGAERNAIEVMRHLRDRYHFVVITMERADKSQGSLHHQLMDIAEAVYDLGELAPYDKYFDMLADLKLVYEPDLIWTTNGSPWFSDNAAHLRELFKDIPIIDQQVYDATRGWILRYREPGVQSFDRFIAINRKIADTFIGRFRIDPERVDLIYHAVDTDRFDPSRYAEEELCAFFEKFKLDQQRKIFVFAGRLTGQKRPLDFLKLALKRQQVRDNAQFVMVGDGDLAPVVDQFIHEHDLQNVRRIPFVENMAELFSIASGLILTSEFEGMPIVILEALCMGVPVLATDVGDVKLMLDQYGAGLTLEDLGDIDTLERGYLSWLTELETFRTQALANAEAIRDRFSGETVAQQYVKSFDRACKPAPTSGRGDLSRLAGMQAKGTQKKDHSGDESPHSKTDLVSIIIPSYNHARFIKCAIDSALGQTYSNVEVIVVDDGSTDDSLSDLMKVKDPRFSYYRQQNHGAHVAINRGLNLASGSFLAILNSDDAFYPDRIEKLMSEFQRDPATELLATWIEVIDVNGEQLAIKEGWHNLEPWPIEHPDLSFQGNTDDFGLNLLRGNFVATTSNILMRRSLNEKIGGMRALRFSHDWDFLLRAASCSKCKLIPQPLMKYRVHDSNTINTNRAWMLFDICWVLAANLHRFEDSRLFNCADVEESKKNLVMLYESINLQGNDKVFWAMRSFIQSLRSLGVENSEELLLQDDELRRRFIGYITV